jgi:hypothetical protein
MKLCPQGSILKTETEFAVCRQRKDKLQYNCKACNVEYRKQHKQVITEYAKNYREQNKELIKCYLMEYRKIHKLKSQLYSIDWSKKNRALKNSYEAKRKSLKLQRTPKWIRKIELRQMKIMYVLAKELSKSTNTTWHVDHIIPLQGKNASGLHDPLNLQVITAKLNLQKGTKVYGDDT